ncbi:MAG: efflux RND transporter periplasmic adaptor subunit, partial [Lysobacterales bacterium]
QVEVGQSLEIGFDAFRERRFAGEVVAIDPVINPTSRSARVRARIANPDGVLRPGLSARLALNVGESRNALLMPEQALLQQGDVRFVYTVKGGKAKKVIVQTGRRVPGEIEIVSGLADGDQVITAGQAKPMMHEGAAVMVVSGESAASAGTPPANAAAPGTKPAPAQATAE